MKPVQAGKFRHVVKILAPPDPEGAQGAQGDPTGPPRVLAAEWDCSIEPLTGREFYEGKQVQSDTTHMVKLRYFAGLNDSHYFLGLEDMNGRQFNIVSVRDIEELNVLMVCECREAPVLQPAASKAE